MSMSQKQFLLIFCLCLLNLKLYAEIITDGTVGTATTLVGPNFMIVDKLGQQLGSNLFHSFKTFDVNTGESATFSGLNSVENILARVTGGNRSFINGTLSSTIPNANLYLLNPSGISFGENAYLDVEGSFHASTADYIRLGENGNFSASHPNHSVLTVAQPDAFGFLDNNPASLVIQGSYIKTNNSKTLSLIGGDLEINDSILFSSGGRINLVAVASIGEVMFTHSDLAVNTFEELGKITLLESSLDRRKERAFFETSKVFGVEIELANIDVSDMLTSKGAGQISILANQFILDKAWIFADTYGNKNGLGIDIFVDGNMHLNNGARITTDNFKNAQGGRINITTTSVLQFSGQNVDVTDDIDSLSTIATNNKGTGIGGEIYINTPTLTINPGLIQAATEDSGDAGNIFIDAGQVSQEGGLINASTTSLGQAGNITITATNKISLSNVSSISASTATGSSGNAGDIKLNTQYLTLQNRGEINNFSGGNGNAGSINITTNTASLTQESTISTQAAQARGGYIHFDVRDHLYVFNESQITAQACGDNFEDSGGNITINKPALFVLDKSQLFANAKNGNGGNIHITTDYFIDSIDNIIDASSKLGIDGEVQINTRNMDFIDIQLPLPPPLPPTILLNRCSSPAKGLSSFSIMPRNGLLSSPYDLKH